MTNHDWIEFTGSDEQIADLRGAAHGFICKNAGVESGVLTIKYGQLFSDVQAQPILDAMYKDSIKHFLNKYKTTHYRIIHDDPLREMKIRQARTGQPVWVRTRLDDWSSGHLKDFYKLHEPTTKPDWDLIDSEYRFTPFEEEV